MNSSSHLLKVKTAKAAKNARPLLLSIGQDWDRHYGSAAIAVRMSGVPEELLETVSDHLEACTTCESTVSAMDEMSDSFISELRMPAGDELFLEETQFQQGAALVAAIGRDPSRVAALALLAHGHRRRRA